MEQFEQLVTLMEKNQIAALKKRLGGMNATDVAAFLENLDPEKRLLVFRVLPKDLAADAFTYLPAEMQQTIVETISDGEVSRLADELCLDDTVDFLEVVPANVVKKVLRNVDKETRERITEFLKYPKNSAGSLMTVEFVELHDRLTVGQALDTVRREGDQMETVDTLYTIDNTHHLTGTLTLLDLVRADSSRKISELKHAPAAVARTLEDQEEVAADFSKYDLSHMPVVDGEGRLVGLITVDDIVDVIQDENTEDMEKMAAMAPSEKPYLKTSPWDLAKHRILWLLALMLSATITGRIITGFEELLAQAVVLTAFIPMLMDTGGNCGAQSSTMVIRGLALGQIAPRDIGRVLWKELRVSIICGVMLGVVNFARILCFEQVGAAVALAVSLSLVVTVICSKCVGGLLPILAKMVHLDPAVMASPLITTLVDTVSLLVFFSFSKMILGI